MWRIARYGKGTYWALYDGQKLVAVTVYKRGAQEVVRRLEAAHQAPDTSPTLPRVSMPGPPGTRCHGQEPVPWVGPAGGTPGGAGAGMTRAGTA